jgi:D-amino-acid dehydrogenase
LRAAHDLNYDQRTEGFIYFYRTAKSFEATRATALGVDDPRVRPKPLLGDVLLAVEPAIAHAKVPFTGGLRYDQDESGDAWLFTMGVAQAATNAGVQFRFSAEATGVLVDGNRVRGICLSAKGSRADLATDAVVIAAGINSRDLAAPFGIRLPIYPVKGDSITLQTADRAALPRHAMRGYLLKNCTNAPR